ncbi:hypothetical protein NGB36_28880 [Streptomyces sp. RB6PN25]|uniref:CBM2 domain-containing protein n=1 Tax=Streptomyces humicola TaxID=2953240 RepID=A0ABT1Q3I5_9ACTN|nr:hypothetical protein [Streptomyces humicola]MCQ4084482.1 hypothetical protein [Streptomyces humicola]
MGALVRTVTRRGALAASAGVLCLAALAWWVAAPDVGGGGGGGYLAAGPAGPPQGAGHVVPPTAKVTMVPLPQGGSSASPASPASSASSSDGSGATGSAPGPTPGASVPPGSLPPDPPGAGVSRTAPATAPSSPGSGGRPAHLTMSAPQDAATDVPWCQNVTVTFTNTGEVPATSGTVTFATHIIGLLGIDWGTVDTAEKVPVPIAGGVRVTRTWQICLDSWRVPLGTRLDTESAALSGT